MVKRKKSIQLDFATWKSRLFFLCLIVGKTFFLISNRIRISRFVGVDRVRLHIAEFDNRILDEFYAEENIICCNQNSITK